MDERKIKALREVIDTILELYEYHLREGAGEDGKRDLEVIRNLLRAFKDEDYDAWMALMEYSINAQTSAFKRVYPNML